ncbi:MAG: hypothetical protein DGJ47_000175 [Rickettsiaceae bacterium]
MPKNNKRKSSEPTISSPSASPKNKLIAFHIANEHVTDMLTHYYHNNDIKGVINEINCGTSLIINDRTSYLHEACKIGHLEFVKLFLNNRDYIDTNKKKLDLLSYVETTLSQTPLLAAINSRHTTPERKVEICELLLDAGTNIHYTDGYKMTPMDHARASYNLDLFKLLVNKMDESDLKKYYSPLASDEFVQHAFKVKDRETLEILLKYNNSNIDHSITILDHTPLYMACIQNDIDFAKWLLAKGADKNHPCMKHIAMSPEVTKLLGTRDDQRAIKPQRKQEKADVEELPIEQEPEKINAANLKMQKELEEAKANNLEMNQELGKIIEENIKLKDKTKTITTKRLVEAKKLLEIKNEKLDLEEQLLIADNQKFDMEQKLEEANAQNLEMQKKLRETEELLNLLQQEKEESKNAEQKIETKKEESDEEIVEQDNQLIDKKLLAALEGKNLDEARDLIKKAPDALNRVNKDGTASSKLLESNNIELLKFFVEHDTNFNKSQSLEKACEQNNTNLALYLLSHGAEQDTLSKKHNKFIEKVNKQLSILCRNSDFEKIDKLLEEGVNIDQTDKKGQSALGSMAFVGNLEAVKFLVERGADVNHARQDGSTPLDGAVNQGQKDIAKYLFDNGGTISAPINHKKITPLGKALDVNATNLIISLLEKNKYSTIVINELAKRIAPESLQSEFPSLQDVVKGYSRAGYTLTQQKSNLDDFSLANGNFPENNDLDLAGIESNGNILELTNG